jgi:hypothetical protein
MGPGEVVWRKENSVKSLWHRPFKESTDISSDVP